jgi:hypothetical protein
MSSIPATNLGPWRAPSDHAIQIMHLGQGQVGAIFLMQIVSLDTKHTMVIYSPLHKNSILFLLFQHNVC